MIFAWFMNTSVGRTVAAALALLVAGSIAYQRVRRGGVLDERERINAETRAARERALVKRSEVTDEVNALTDDAARNRLSRWVR